MQELKKMKDKHFDLIIANPPYGNSHNDMCKKITDYIIHNIDYDRYINCQPVDGYKYNDNYKYVDTDKMYFPKKFTGASVHTSVAEVLNKPRYSITEEIFTIYTYEESLYKYYFGNREREATFTCTDITMKWKDYRTEEDVPEHTFLIYKLAACDGVHTAGADVEWNVNKVHNLSILNKNIGTKTYHYIPVTFNTEEELVNFTNWWYNDPKSGLATKILNGMHIRNTNKYSTIIPRVDWSHPWTDEEILRDYGYTEKEIEEILK